MKEFLQKVKNCILEEKVTIFLSFIAFITALHIIVHISFHFSNNTVNHIDSLRKKFPEQHLIIARQNGDYLVITERHNIYLCETTFFDILLSPCEKTENIKGVVFLNENRKRVFLEKTKDRAY